MTEDSQPPKEPSSMQAFKEMSQDEIIEYLQASAPEAKCPSCQGDVWTLPDTTRNGIVSLPLAMPGHGLFTSKAALPVVPLVCENCGDVRLVSAVAMGMWKLAKDKK